VYLAKLDAGICHPSQAAHTIAHQPHAPCTGLSPLFTCSTGAGIRANEAPDFPSGSAPLSAIIIEWTAGSREQRMPTHCPFSFSTQSTRYVLPIPAYNLHVRALHREAND
jgi:hypothetical protein